MKKLILLIFTITVINACANNNSKQASNVQHERAEDLSGDVEKIKKNEITKKVDTAIEVGNKFKTLKNVYDVFIK